ncbi:MAG: PDZ domain-containing protein [Rhodoferax sp.]|nr:PDZ domain-containing protein [Rhodoferax sp.]
MTRRSLALTLLAAALVFAASAVALARWFPQSWTFDAHAGLREILRGLPGPAESEAQGARPGYRHVVRQVAPTVVAIVVSGLRPLEPTQTAGRGRTPKGHAPFQNQGSGFILHSDGLIMTNAHVVRDALRISVRLKDRRTFDATLLGLDTATDIALLRIQANGLPVVTLGDTSDLQVGDPVLAIGSPFGLEQSATQGIVSAIARSLPGDGVVPFIQTDAAVNPGSSGGPLFNGDGRVIGVNAQIYSYSGGYQGMSFAVPIGLALRVKDQILRLGRASHAQLGVAVQDLDQRLAAAFHRESAEGVLVVLVAPDSAASGAGLSVGDLITHFNEDRVRDGADLGRRIGDALPGQSVRLSIWRDGRALALVAQLGRVREPEQRAPPALLAVPSDEGPGLALRALSENELASSQLPGALVIENVSGPAARAGLLPGDLLLAVNSTWVRAVADLRAALARHPDPVALLVQRGDERLFMPADLR